MNLPNTLSLFRIIIAAVFTACLALPMESYSSHWAVRAALICFIIAAITDFLDGYLARKLNLVTDLGKLLDPLADKILVAAAFVMLTEMGICPGWAAVVILFREFAVTGLRLLLVEKGTVLPADNIGKWKTTAQMAYCICALAGLAFSSSLGGLMPVAQVVLYIAVALTLLSGANYLRAGVKLLK